ncbi:hypothetical protein EMCRGX_G032506 [Ephydatia muelleri]|eukprot:Em0019g200a
MQGYILLFSWIVSGFALNPADLNAFGELGSGLTTPQLTTSSPTSTAAPGIAIFLPVCAAGEYLTSDGTNLLCRPLPACNCQYNCNADPPLPPRGCPVVAPPMQGALVCVRTVDTMYCSVYCDNLFEFASTPLNPYYCGAYTNFKWTDYVTKQTHTELPRCTGIRYRNSLLFPSSNYLPAPCYGLDNSTTLAILANFQATLVARSCVNCPLQNVFLDCPSVAGSVLFYKDIASTIG